MSEIKIKEMNELVNPALAPSDDNLETFYPKTHEKAVVDDDGNTLDSKIESMMEDVDEAIAGCIQDMNSIKSQTISEAGAILNGGAVRADIVQSLTDAQKARALENQGVVIAQGSDFTNPDATKRAKVPTVGAVLDGLNDGVYDVSKRNPTGGPNSDGKFTLEYILNNADTLIPTSRRHGGMLISFVQSSDNKYVQFFLTKNVWSANEADWEKMNLEEEVSQLSKDVDVLELSIFGLNNVIDIETTAGTKISNYVKHYISVVPNVEFQMEYTDNGVLPSGGSISVTFYDASDNELSILVDNVSKQSTSFSASIVNHTIKCVSDISYFKVYTSNSSIPTSDAGVSFTITQGENTIQEQIDTLETDLNVETTSRGNADANLQGQIDGIAESVLVKEELTPTILSSYEISSGVISSGAVAQRSVLYVPILEGDKIRVTLTNTSTNNRGYYGYTTQLPANGVTVNSATEIGDATKIDWTAPTDGYFVIGIHATYHKNVKMYRVVGLAEKMSELEETINVTYKRNEHASIYDKKVLNVLYSVISGIPGNTEAHFMDGIERGFNGLKADMRMTSDGKIILCHDAGFTLDGNGRITTYDAENNTEIHDLTILQCLELEFAEQVDGQYIHPCSLDRFLFLCKKYGVVPYVTIRWDDYRDATLAEFYRLLKHYNLVDKVIINLFSGAPQWATKIQATDATLMCCNTIATSANLTSSVIDDCFDWGCNYVCVYYTNFASITDELVQYAFSKNVRVMVYGIHTNEEFDECVAGGVVGFQNYSRTAVFPL